MEEDTKNDEAQESADQSSSAMEELKKTCEEYLNNWKRERADFLNYKKAEAERVGDLVNYEREAMILDILPVLDSIYLAEKHAPDEIRKDLWFQGFSHTKKQLEDLLRREGVESIETVGKAFDPATMDAIGESDGEGHATVVEELQKGYIFQGKIIRPAKVKVTK